MFDRSVLVMLALMAIALEQSSMRRTKTFPVEVTTFFYCFFLVNKYTLENCNPAGLEISLTPNRYKYKTSWRDTSQTPPTKTEGACNLCESLHSSGSRVGRLAFHLIAAHGILSLTVPLRRVTTSLSGLPNQIVTFSRSVATTQQRK